jgi:hypothetical protein
MRMRRETVFFVLFLAALLGAGLLLGRAVASYPKLETFKLLNIVGITYELLGLLVLSEIVSNSERWKSLVVHWLAGLLLWAQSVVPLGAALGAWASGDAPSSTKAAAFFGSLWMYSLLPLAVLDATVFYPRMLARQDMTKRTRRFGLMLLVSGAIVQLLAAFQDFYA